MHVQVRDLLLRVDGHVLILLYLNFLVDVEYLHVVEGKIDIFEGEYCFHRHEQGDACLDWKTFMLLGERVLY